MMPSAILIHGRKGVGKDTLGDYLFSNYGYQSVAIADAVKYFLEISNPLLWVEEGEVRLTQLLRRTGSWERAKRRYPQVRDLLQSIGQGARDVFGGDFWLDRCRDLLDSHMELYPHNRTVITDIRYENELWNLKQYFGPSVRTLKLCRPGVASDGHPSEEGLPDHLFDTVLENVSTPQALFEKLEMTLSIWHVETKEQAA